MTDNSVPLITHLIELRSRLLRAVIAILVIFLGLVYFANDLYHWIAEPLIAQLPEGSNMIATNVAAPFFTPFKLTIVVAMALAMPVVLHQAWGFIAPGLYRHERRLAIPLLMMSVLLFYGGIAFAFYVVFPLAFSFFTSVAPDDVVIATDISSYLDFVLKILFAFGLAFEIPIAVILLCVSGVTSPASLRKKRPYVIVAAFVIGMLLTPPDVISQTLLALPMWLLFELGVLMSSLYSRKREEQNEEESDVKS
ncbi:Sec-independent protein translocase protein TatC [Neiella marina]|uniref:Sec-independent protein translocase protein TatC n=1 Tax=Neiella marina TaxID=508461 RepID=A0A8J2U1U2_9GAMM|nr:twin-arginine translocase subunit TatC [Neiella marina]GGA64425.1 Sec-independent protein translocase protein TatC [Neiella marina]